MLRNWRVWVLMILLSGPYVVFMGLGWYWLWGQGWVPVIAAGIVWVLLNGVFYVLADRWTRSKNPLLPPLDWDAPRTFSPRDREALALVEQEAEQVEKVSMHALAGFDIYVETGRRLADRLAKHYYPKSRDPIENVPVVEMLTALELAAEDLNRLCREIPGGDIITPGHGKQAAQMAGYIQKASDIYTYLLPLFSPVTGLARLGTQTLVARPAWKNMQQSLMRWFFRAYVNRLGMHLIELYSGRLAIGADRYRRLTRRTAQAIQQAEEDSQAPVVAVVGAQGAGKSVLIAGLQKAIDDGDLGPIQEKLAASGRDKGLVERLKAVRFIEVPGYKAYPGVDTARERSSRRDAVSAAVEADFMILVIDAARGDASDDVHFANEWRDWYKEHPELDTPPALAIITGSSRLPGNEDPETGNGRDHPAGSAAPSADAARLRESAKREWISGVKKDLPAELGEPIVTDLVAEAPAQVAHAVLPALAARLPKAERVALLRHFHRNATRSPARRVLNQVGRQGRRLWSQLRTRGQKQEEEVG
ncbi:hypothetical protein BH23PLA1_BH23PLA1_41550 [soil metagenome]